MLNGIINIYKEKGFTSHDIVAIVRKTLKIKKVGHTGTLDPNAEGVLPICIGKGTKISEYVTSNIKEYKTILKLGICTDTQDITGNIIKTSEVNCDKNTIKNIILSFIGDYKQVPPMYSAIKVKGKKLYELARKGENIELAPRLVKIFDIKICNFLGKDRIELIVKCSKGTYIRTLCKDIGEKLKTGGTMESLTRIKNGIFTIENSIKIEDFKKLYSLGKIKEYIISLDNILKDFEKIEIEEEGNKYLYNGNKINIKYTKNNLDMKKNKKYLLYDNKKNLIGIYQLKDSIFLKPLTMLIDLSNINR